ncbi:hypothetical protein FB45DRAFT_1050950 [Roridomyces roridus]|uniref:Cell wall protein n=1 Tax=Roridomyces roridus TaxID=1738132 RepID=A0AAD7CKL1_9AGAR|nr:hypothetical protein FB45DRAFT_1050950 [Roridomyces roridus]
MARIVLYVLPMFLHAFAAPVRRISSNLACLTPNVQVSSAQTSLSLINVLADVNTTGPLLDAQTALFNASQITAVLGGFPPVIGAPPVKIDANSQTELLSALKVAQDSLAQIRITNNAVVNTTRQNFDEAVAFVEKAVDAAGKINSDCLSTDGAGSTAAGVGSTAPEVKTVVKTVTDVNGASEVTTAIANTATESAAPTTATFTGANGAPFTVTFTPGAPFATFSPATRVTTAIANKATESAPTTATFTGANGAPFTVTFTPGAPFATFSPA